MSGIKINHPVNPAPEGAETWTTAEMQEAFTDVQFGGGMLSVTRKSDGQRGTLAFNGTPRVYHTFQED